MLKTGLDSIDVCTFWVERYLIGTPDGNILKNTLTNGVHILI